MNYCVVTTINKPTKAIEKLYELFGEGLVIIGDEKTPEGWHYREVRPIHFLEKHYTPNNHYARKNIGYLLAIKSKAELIYDTDDDNIPNENWKIRGYEAEANEAAAYHRWCNVYSIFGGENIWPRGFSLKHLRKIIELNFDKENIVSSIQQGLSDGEPDVDAIWRLTVNTKNKFSENRSVYLKSNSWCPFNSQSTWWFPKAYPLMYLPIYATFRMTDIWRSFVAQRCLWQLGESITFHSPAEVFQDRNEHDLMKDFADEVPGYLHNDEIVETLSLLKLESGEENVCKNLLTCYQAIVDKEILPETEIRSVKAWIKDYEAATRAI